MRSMRAWVGLCCVVASGGCVNIPRADGGADASGDAAAEAMVDTVSTEAGADASMDADASVAMDAEAGVDMDAEASVEAAVDAAPDADASDARACDGGQTQCGATCADTQTSALHCGVCGNACTGGRSCVSGTCQCAGAAVECGGACTVTSSDRNNCGACGTVCPAGIGCMGGTCSCPMGSSTVCAGACTDTQTNALHCGACGNACPMGQSCVAGRCECPGAQRLCGGACVDTQTNNSHCGACGTACTSPERCVAGACRCAAATETLCSGACVDTQTSAAHCGRCGNACGGGRTCQAGTCACPFPQSDCGGATCLDLTTDVNNCGACGMVCTPPANTVPACNGGCTFTCRAGFGDCDGNMANGCEVDLSSARNNCGACGTFCDGTCTGGSCGEWARAMDESNGGLWPRAMASDGDGNVYIAATFTNRLTIAPGRTLTAVGASGGFVASFTSAGTLRWSRVIDTAMSDYVQSIAVRGSGAATVVAIAGATQTDVNVGGAVLSAPGSYRAFVATYRGDGSHVWSQMWSSDGAPSLPDLARGIAISPVNGDIAVTAGFSRVLTGSGWGTSAGVAARNMAIVRFDRAGAPLATTRVFSAPSGSALVPRAVGYNGGGDVCVAAMLSGQVDDGGGLLGTVGSVDDIFAGCYTSAGARRWSFTSSAGGTQNPTAMYVDEVNGNVTIGGAFHGTTDFGGMMLVASGTDDAFVAQYSLTGAMRWAQRIGTNNASEQLSGLVVGSSGELFAFGALQGVFTFGSSSLTTGFSRQNFLAALNLGSGAAIRAALLAGGGTQYSNALSRCGAGFLCMLGTYGGGTLSVRSATLPMPPVSYDAFLGRMSESL
jgi:hypothetical protein